MHHTRMKTTHLMVALLLAVALAVTGCGAASSNGSSSSAGSGSGASATAPSGGGTAGATSCPTQNTRAFAKTRLVADLGLTAGTFHRYIYKPFRAGSFTRGTHGRTLALIKAAAVAALDVHLLSNAVKNIKANPTLCNALVVPMTNLENKLSSLKGDVTSGNLSAVTAAEPVLSGLESKAASEGLKVVETTPGTGTP